MMWISYLLLLLLLLHLFVGLLKRLTTLKVDDNQLTILPNAIGK